MAASPVTIQTAPLYLTARTLVYTAQELRKPMDELIGPGVKDYDSFRIRQRAAGANMSVDGMTASIQNVAWVRGATVADQGLYRVDFNNATQLNVDIPTSDPTNPRIDSIYLAVEDQQHVGSNNLATLRVVVGTPTGGATLDNRTGAGAAPANMASILLADVLVGAAVATITNANIRDRRPLCIEGPSYMTTAKEQVTFQPVPALMGTLSGLSGLNRISHAVHDLQQVFAACFLPKRIINATGVRWAYFHGSTALTGNWRIGIYDASGRKIAETGSTAFSGAANARFLEIAATIPSTTFEAGLYFVGIGYDTSAGQAATSGVAFEITTTDGYGGVPAHNCAYRSATGGVTLPTTINSLTDLATTAGTLSCPPCPIVTLSNPT
jgi:hypothetical protein